ncbi:DUF3099 domain-containing protein [Winogradskya humida]|uniref:DUF3099 family protein n=1 Tax=Winogradskya humida TaxID=113566 RepID=A0ABQ3ZSU6_9ACTN|nr:DUF3099 domain-containing protein [Actinoplanes humidus]GIE21676.1 hypothetical protein Ahu01nite_047780 [Actinoplanes humidus]
MKKQPERPVLITDAARSQGDQLRTRQIRYVTMMGIRSLCLILGAVLISIQPPLLPVWLILCALGMVLLPWMAVLIANDRPPKSRENPAAPQPQHTTQPMLEKHSEEEEIQHRTIDVEP